MSDSDKIALNKSEPEKSINPMKTVQTPPMPTKEQRDSGNKSFSLGGDLNDRRK